jgi:hypothetical protein
MGGQKFTLIAYPEQGRAEVEAACPFTLCLNGKEILCSAGKNEISLSAGEV